MMSAFEIVTAIFGVVIAALVIWGIVRIINDRRRLRVARRAAAVAACLWLPFTWLVLTRGPWDSYRLTWIKMWPILPGFLPGALLFHPQQEALEFSTMAVTTLVLLLALTWLGCRGRGSLIAAVLVALLISIPTAMIAYTVYLS
ncbi:MAG: hypothetical protein HY290_04455 [Planctomycetia bacterium]|nr:hypothetical protein [Planctomycetia bacterium]